MTVRADDGAATLAAVMLSLVLAVGVAAAGALARAAVAQHRAEAAADLAALSAATAIASFAPEPCAVAARTAQVNKAELVSCVVVHRSAGPEVAVAVRGLARIWPMEAARGSARAGLRALGEANGAHPEAWPP